MDVRQARDYSNLQHGEVHHVRRDTLTQAGTQVPSGKYNVVHEGDKISLMNEQGKIHVGNSDKNKTHWDHAANPLVSGFWDHPAMAIPVRGK